MSRRARVAAASLALCASVCVCLAACGRSSDGSVAAPGRGFAPVRPSAPEVSGPAPTPVLAPPPPAPFRSPMRPSEADPATAAGEWRGRPTAADLAPPPPVTVTQVVGTAPPPQQRDLPGELRAMLGEPASCMPAGQTADLPEHVHLSLSATVTGTGIVVDARASGNLPPAALDCLGARLRAAHFAGNVPDAPRHVSATADYDRAPRPVPPAGSGTTPAPSR